MLQGWIQIAITITLFVAISPLFGGYMARVFQGQRTLLDPVLNPLEGVIFTLSGVRDRPEMNGWQYTRAVLYSNIAACILVGLILFNQALLPFNPTHLNSSAATWDTILHTLVSFVTNTDQQHYSGESTYTYFSQFAGLGLMFFISCATGIAVAIAFIRGLTGRPLGNFYVDLTQAITRILLPMSLVGGVVMLAAGMPETLAGPVVVPTLENPHISQAIALGPVAHFEIIKELGQNGGGFFGVNSAHPFENPNGFTNLLEIVSMVSISAGLIHTYGAMANNPKQAWYIFNMVLIIYIAFVVVAGINEYNGIPGINQLLGSSQPNLEGKEVRFGWAQSALFLTTTTGTMCGAANSAHDSVMPGSLFIALFNMFLQILWGGEGTGTAYLFAYVILAVFATGLMVGRTPEFLGRKIEQREVVLASLLLLLVHPIVILIPGAITLSFPEVAANVTVPGFYNGIFNPGFHGLSEVIYEYTSAAANNGSGLAGLGNSEPAPSALWWNLSCCVVLAIGRYVPIMALLLLADGMSRKQSVPMTSGTLRTDTKLFAGVAAGVILIVGALTFFPVLALGPVAEAFAVL